MDPGFGTGRLIGFGTVPLQPSERRRQNKMGWDVGDVGTPDLVRSIDGDRAGNILCPGAGFVVRGFGPSAEMHISRISRRMRLRLMARPSRCSIFVIRREPRNGQAVNSSLIRLISSRSLSLADAGSR